jgi:hypothetical protein
MMWDQAPHGPLPIILALLFRAITVPGYICLIRAYRSDSRSL